MSCKIDSPFEPNDTRFPQQTLGVSEITLKTVDPSVDALVTRFYVQANVNHSTSGFFRSWLRLVIPGETIEPASARSAQN